MEVLKNNLLWIGLFISIGLNSQNSINCGANSIENDSGSLTFSVGQLFYSSTDSTELSEYQGVQHAYEISIPNTSKLITQDIQAYLYPNPTTSLLFLNVKEIDVKHCSFYLYNQKGQIIFVSKLLNNNTIVNLSGYPKGNYVLMVNDGKTFVKSFKIIKN